VMVSLADGANKEIDAVLSAAVQEPAKAEPAVAAPQQGTEAQPPVPAAPAAAQATTEQKGNAGLSGVVTDQSGAVIPGATVALTGPSGTKTSTANENGHYVVHGLPPGTYKLKVTAPNFAPFETDVNLTAGQTLEMPAGLLPPSAVENVDVTAGGPAQVETGTAHIEGTITE